VNKVLFTTAISFFLVACNVSDIPNFERMNEDELAAYNSGKPISQMIVCSEQDRSFSRVRRRRCMTVEAMYGSAQQAAQLGVLNNIPGVAQTDGN
jgi:hypothetical protein